MTAQVPPLRASLTDLLKLEALGGHRYRSMASFPNLNDVVYGGQVVAQAIMAAAAGEHAKHLNSVHCHFLRSAALDVPLDYRVETLVDGRSFTHKEVRATQQGAFVFSMHASFHTPEALFEHQVAPSRQPPDPETLDNLAGLAERFADAIGPLAYRQLTVRRAFEVRPVEPEAWMLGGPPRRQLWIRAEPYAIPAGASPELTDMAAFAFLSDFWLAAAGAMPHAITPPAATLMMASLDHSIWFHRPVDPREWLLMDTESPVAHAGRTLGRATVFDRHGLAIASLAQEAVMRRRRT